MFKGNESSNPYLPWSAVNLLEGNTGKTTKSSGASSSAEAEAPAPRNKLMWNQTRTLNKHPTCWGIHQSLEGGASLGQAQQNIYSRDTGHLPETQNRGNPQSVGHNGGKKREGNSGKMRHVTCIGKKSKLDILKRHVIKQMNVILAQYLGL